MVGFMSPSEIVGDLLGELGEEERTALVKMEKSDLVQFHFTTGMAIRNKYKLWHEDNPHTVVDSIPNAQGILDHPLHPGQLSMTIMRDLWERVR